MRVLYLDCFSGISGDMTVGALCDLGVKPSALEWELAKLDIGDFHMHVDRARRKNVEGLKFSIHAGATAADHCHESEEDRHGHGHHHEGEHEHAHVHEDEHAHGHSQKSSGHHDDEPSGSHGSPHHGEHEHSHGRAHREIRRLLEASKLAPFVKQHALGIFRRIADAEGKIHGMAADDVHFHEVGALDSIADIVCACAGIEALGLEQVFVSSLHDGHGWIDCAHGRFPVPAPATLEILKGIPLAQIDEPHELITPTGAAIVAEFGSSFGPMPRLRIEKIGYGIGTRDLASRPNVLRAILGELIKE
jgi:uncharacterized protein (DUF111 family)